MFARGTSGYEGAMELRALEIAFALLRPRGFFRRLAILFGVLTGFIAWWARAVQIAPRMAPRRVQSRREIHTEVQRRISGRVATYVADTGGGSATVPGSTVTES